MPCGRNDTLNHQQSHRLADVAIAPETPVSMSARTVVAFMVAVFLGGMAWADVHFRVTDLEKAVAKIEAKIEPQLRPIHETSSVENAGAMFIGKRNP